MSALDEIRARDSQCGVVDQPVSYRDRRTLLARLDAQSLELQRITSDRDAKSARMWELGKLCDEQAAELQAVREALELAYRHIDMEALRVSHCNHAAQIDAALKQSRGV